MHGLTTSTNVRQLMKKIKMECFKLVACVSCENVQHYVFISIHTLKAHREIIPGVTDSYLCTKKLQTHSHIWNKQIKTKQKQNLQQHKGATQTHTQKGWY